MDATPALVRTCDICHAEFPDLPALHGHLTAVHKLPLQDWRPERDLFGTDPVCAHCLGCFPNKAAVRQHVTQGQCPTFDAAKLPYDIPVGTDWISVLQSGDVLGLMTNPSQCMRLTLRCQQCGSGFQRQMDLQNHLQSVHSDHWLRAQPTTQLLISTCAPAIGCLCNPATHSRSVSHICPAYRQLAMLMLRTDIPVLVPWRLDLDTIHAKLCNVWTHPTIETLLAFLRDRSFHTMMSDPTIHQLLSSTCLWCGSEPHPLTLHAHIQTAHPLEAARQIDLLPQILQWFLQQVETDHVCRFCQLTFNHPVLGTETADDLEARALLVQVHLQHQCPVVQQLCILLQHGRPGHSGDQPRGNQGTPSGVQRHGTSAPCQPDRAKRRRTRLQKGQEESHLVTGTEISDHCGHNAGASTHGSNDPSTGPRHAGSEETRLLSLLHAKRRSSSTTSPGGHCEEMASPSVTDGPHHDGLIDLCASESDPGADHGAGPAGTPDQAEPKSATRGDLRDSNQMRPDQQRRLIPLPPMECPRTEASDHGQGGYPDGQDAPLCSAIGRGDEGLHSHCQVPRAEIAREGIDHPLGPSDFLATGRAFRPADNADGKQSMELAGDVLETTLSPSESHVSSASANVGKRQSEGQGQRVFALTGPFGDRTRACHALGNLMLLNDCNHCYINAAFMAMMWAMLNRFDFELQHLGMNASRIVQFLLCSDDSPCSLAHQDWMRPVLEGWASPDHQGDPTEFSTFLMRGLQMTGLNMSWERRFALGNETYCADKSQALQPLVLHFDMETVEDDQVPLQALINSWMNHLGMQTALVADTTLICLQLDRSFHTASGQLDKCNAAVGIHGGVDIPFVSSQGVQVFQRDFQVISAIAHVGQDQSGHCRCILKTWPDTTNPAEPCLFLLTDDNQKPERIWREPTWFAQNITCLWLCDCTWMDLQQIPKPDCTAQVMRTSLPTSEHRITAPAVLQLFSTDAK